MIIELDSILDKTENTENTDTPWFAKLGISRSPKIGDIFIDVQQGDKYVLSQVDCLQYCLISLRSFNRWQEPVLVSEKMTENQWDLISHKKTFKCDEKLVVILGKSFDGNHK